MDLNRAVRDGIQRALDETVKSMVEEAIRKNERIRLLMDKLVATQVNKALKELEEEPEGRHNAGT